MAPSRWVALHLALATCLASTVSSSAGVEVGSGGGGVIFRGRGRQGSTAFTPSPRITAVPSTAGTKSSYFVAASAAPTRAGKRPVGPGMSMVDDAAEKSSEDGSSGGGGIALASLGGASPGQASLPTVDASSLGAGRTKSTPPEGPSDVRDRADAAAMAVKRGVTALPGTWWAAGLPRWMHTVRRRMITKEDWFHLHAASGMLYLVGGSLWMLNVMGLEIFTGVPQLETSTPIPLLLLGAGLANILSSIPMANTRSWILSGLCPSVVQLWFAWQVSGCYPASLAPADPWFAAAGLSVLIIATVEAHEANVRERKARDLVRQSGRHWRPSGHVQMRGNDYEIGDFVNIGGALANALFNAPHLYATLVGSGWVERLAEAYPAAPALLFHAYFALATSASLSLLAPTLYTRRLIDIKGLTAMQFLTLAPVVSSIIDASVMGAAATNNPLEIYLGFLH